MHDRANVPNVTIVRVRSNKLDEKAVLFKRTLMTAQIFKDAYTSCKACAVINTAFILKQKYSPQEGRSHFHR